MEFSGWLEETLDEIYISLGTTENEKELIERYISSCYSYNERNVKDCLIFCLGKNKFTNLANSYDKGKRSAFINELNEILEEVEKTAVITYKTYGVTVNGEVKTEVDTEAKALEIINNLGQDVEEGVDFELGYTEIYTVGENTFASEDEAIGIVSEIKTAKVTEYEEEQARIAAEKAAAEAAAKEAARKAAAAKATYTSTSTTVSGSYGNVNGISISNPLKASALITSRFGEVHLDQVLIQVLI